MTLDAELVAKALPSYEVMGELGRGGWGVVLGGRHRSLERAVAIKQLPRAFGVDPEVRTRFVAEAKLLASLSHPHIVPVYDYVEQDGLCLLVMEQLTGGSAWNRFIEEGFTPEAACAAVMAALSGLHHAHQRGVLHRDVKPANLMFSAEGMLKVTDFGMAKVVGGGATYATQAGEVLGTPAYMAPEQARGRELGPYTDVYAAGVVLYELLSGQLPFSEEGDSMAVLYRHVHEDPIPLQEVAPQVAPAIATVVHHALERDVAARAASAEELGVAIGHAATSTWGPGWLERARLPVMASGWVRAVIDDPTGAAKAVTTPVEPTSSRPADARTDAAAPLTITEAEPVPAGGGAPASAPVRPSEARRRATVGPARVEAAELVPLGQGGRRARSWLLSAAAVLLLVLTLVLATRLEQPDRGGDLAPGVVTVAGVDPTSDEPVEVDLSEPVPVRVAPEDTSLEELGSLVEVGTEVRLQFSAGGMSLGEASAPLETDADGVQANLDASGSRLLVVGEVQAELSFEAAGETIRHSFPVHPTGAGLLTTLPGWLAIVLLLGSVGVAVVVLRSVRRDGLPSWGPVVTAGAGAAFGIGAVLFATVAGRGEPSVATFVLCAILGAGAGTAAGLAATGLPGRAAG